MIQLTRKRLIASIAIVGAAVLLLTVVGSSRGAATGSGPTMPMVAGGGSSPGTDVAPNSVDIANFAFTPAILTVPAGTTVMWTNRDSIAHTVFDTKDGISSPVLDKNSTYSHTFTKPGTYQYICSIHPFMHGVVVVIGS
jgi:amicyanin